MPTITQVPTLRADHPQVNLGFQKIVASLQSIYQFLSFRQPWQRLALGTGITAFGKPSREPSYYKDLFSRVDTTATLKNTSGGAWAAGTVLWNYPIGYRPGKDFVAVGDLNSGFFSADVKADGSVVSRQSIPNGQTATLNFSFLAEQ